MQWSPLDLKNLAAVFDDMADQVLNFRVQNGGALSQAQKNQLTELFGQLDSQGEELENEALKGALVDIDASVVNLQNATHDAKSALKTITNVQNAISIAVAAVGLGAALLNPTPGSIAGSLDTLVQAIKTANTKPATDPGAAAPKTP
ncbi:MAG: hypothetical protein ABSD72_07495 [Terracidiphilus sp.]|jgi:hypothetical protein